MKNMKKTVVWLGIGLFSTLLISDVALADHYGRRGTRPRNEIRQDMREIQKSRSELRDNLRELQRDRAELWRDMRRGAPEAEIARERAEVRQSQREVYQSQRELWRDQAELNRDLARYGWYRDADGEWRRGYYGWDDYNRRDRDRSSWWDWRNWR